MKFIIGLIVLIMVPLTACAGEMTVTETITKTVSNTQTKTVTQPKTLTTTQTQSITITETQTKPVAHEQTIIKTQTQTEIYTTRLTDNIFGYMDAVLLAEKHAIGIKLHHYVYTDTKIFIDREDSGFSAIINYLKNCVSGRINFKTMTTVDNGITKTVDITIPYAYGYFLDFILSDGTVLSFDAASNTVWFETEDTIYNAAILDPSFVDFLEVVLPITNLPLPE